MKSNFSELPKLPRIGRKHRSKNRLAGSIAVNSSSSYPQPYSRPTTPGSFDSLAPIDWIKAISPHTPHDSAKSNAFGVYSLAWSHYTCGRGSCWNEITHTIVFVTDEGGLIEAHSSMPE